MNTNTKQLLSLGVFLSLSTYILIHPDPTPWEWITLSWISEIRTPLLTFLFSQITHLADFEVIVFISCIFTGLLCVAQKPWQAIQFGSSIILGGSSMQISKWILDRPRPLEIFGIIDAEYSSYPSGHATMGALLYGWIIIWLTNRFNTRARLISRILGFILISAIPISRLYLGVHWPLDILGGISLGLFFLSFYPTKSVPKPSS